MELYHTFSHSCKYNYAFYKCKTLWYDSNSETRRAENTEPYMEFSRRYIHYGIGNEDDPLRGLRQQRCDI